MKNLFQSPQKRARICTIQPVFGQKFKLLLVLIPFLLLSLHSCDLLPEEEDKKEEVDEDDEEPEVDSLLPNSDDGSLMGIVEFEVEVSDDEDIEEVEFRIYKADADEEPGELLLEEVIEDDSFTVTWDSESMGEDGNIIVEIIAIDESDNESDEETEVYYVKNDIIGVNENLAYTNAYLWITDTQTGAIIDELEIKNQVFSKKSLRRKNGYTGSEVNYHIYDYSSSDGNTTLESYYGLSELYHDPVPAELAWQYRTDYAGDISVSVSDYQGNPYDLALLNVNGFGYVGYDSDDTFLSTIWNFPLYDTRADNDLYFLFEPYGYAKADISTLTSGDLLILGIEDFSADAQYHELTSTFPLAAAYVYYNPWQGSVSEFKYYPRQQIMSKNYSYEQNVTTASFILPNTDFRNYNEVSYYAFLDDSGEKLHRHRAWGSVPTNMPTYAADLTLFNEDVSNLSITTSGTYDIVRVVASAYDTDDDYHAWAAISKDGNIPFPSIPQALSNIFPQNIFENGRDAYISASILDYDHLQINHMDEFVYLWLTNQEWYDVNTLDEVYISKYLDSSTGRHAKGQDLKRHNPEIQKKGILEVRKVPLQ